MVTPTEGHENQPALDLLWRACFRWKLRPRQITGDTTSGTVENIAAIEHQGLRAFVPLSEVGQRAGMFGEQDCVYDPAADTYRCPGSETLRFLSYCRNRQRRIYAAPSPACTACARRPRCTTAQRGRRIGRQTFETYVDRVRGYHTTEPYAKAMCKRQVWVKPLIAEGARPGTGCGSSGGGWSTSPVRRCSLRRGRT